MIPGISGKPEYRSVMNHVMAAGSARLVLATTIFLALIAGMLVAVAGSAQASGLTSISLVDTDITMQPDLAPNTWLNNAPAATTQTHLLASFADGSASYTVDGGGLVTLLSDDTSPVIAVQVGLTTISLTHTAGDNTVTTYTIYIKNQVPLTGVSVETGSGAVPLSPVFDPTTFTYSVSVPHDDSVARIKSTWNSSYPTVSSYSYWVGWGPSGGGTSGTWSNWGDLNVGDNRWCPALVGNTAQGGTPTEYYCITITRAAAFSSSTLSGISFDDSAVPSSGGLTSTSTPFEFYAVADWGATQTHLTATFAAGSVTYAVDGVSVGSLSSGARSGPIALHPGDNVVTVTHTALDSTVTTYTVHVLSRQVIDVIEVETGRGVVNLLPAFDPLTVTYQVTVPHDDTQIRFKSTWNTSADPSITSYNYWVGWGPGGGSTSGTWSNYASLNVGDNRMCPILEIRTAVHNVGEYYCITITRAAAFSSSTLSGISFDDSAVPSSGGLTSTSTPFEFYAVADWGATQTHLTATFAAGSVTYAVDGVSVGSLSSGARSGPIALHPGDNVVTVTHTALDSTVTTYTVHVLSRQVIDVIEVETGRGVVNLLPAFDPLTVTYQVTVPHDDTQIRFKSTWNTSADPSITSYNYWVGWGPGGGSTSGTWSNYASLNVGDNRMCPILEIRTAVHNVGEYYCITTTRASAFAAITSVTVPGVPAAGTPVPAGSSISASPAGVSGTPTPTVTYNWEAADDSTFTSSTVVATTTTPSWTPDNTVADKYVRVSATADNGVSTPTTVTSAVFGPIAATGEAPGIGSVSIVGTPEVGATLTASATSVTGHPTPTLTYSWESAPDGTSTFAPLGVTTATFTPRALDVGTTIRVVTTASNGVGSPAVLTSGATSPVVAGSTDAPADPTAPPGRAVNVTAVAVDDVAVITWSAPANHGDFPVSTYQVLSRPGAHTCMSAGTTCRITGLERSREYSFTVRALSGSGWGPWSTPSNSIMLTPVDVVNPSIIITGYRDDARTRSGVVVLGVTTGLPEGTALTARVKLPGQKRYQPERGSAVITLDQTNADRSRTGRFTWVRQTSKRVHVFFTTQSGLRSQRVIIPAR